MRLDPESAGWLVLRGLTTRPLPDTRVSLPDMRNFSGVKWTVGSCALAAALLVAGCSSGAQANRAAAAQPSGPAANVYFCMSNQSSRTVQVSMSGNGGGYSDVGSGSEMCSDGFALYGADVVGSIDVDGSKIMDYAASRPALWTSWVKLIQPTFGQCLYSSYSQGGGASYEDGVLRYSIKRGDDTLTGDQEKPLETTNFRITLLDPQKPSRDGAPVKCY
jgi:hypothetical protein